ncbi:unnamed protein product [Adineta steineri]|uniref:UV radiation resistance-associated gene protein-like n=1 Tax=Adineta steineri TaxID=433720 RepID=A0A814CHD2_9BILA|nr:unnamed protein product [Adineta steineri]
MSLTGIKKSPLVALPFLKKRLRRITALGFRNLTVNEFNFTIYFTLHRNDKTVAFYTSESVENQRSPEWSYLEFPINVQCLQDFVIRVWIKTLNNCRLFLEYDVYLDDSLMPDEQKDDSYINNNSLWLEIFGYRFTDNPSKLKHQKSIQQMTISEKKSKRNLLVKSYNKSSILRMMNVIDAIRAQSRLSIQCLENLQQSVNENEDYFSKIKERETRQLHIENLREYLQCQITIYERQLNINQRRQKLINEKKNRLNQNLLQLVVQQKELNLRINNLNQSKYLLHDLIQLIIFRQKNLISNIYHHIYPITSDNNNEYSIGNIKLPPAEDKSYQPLTREREYEIGAGVGYCAHIVLIISYIIQLPLRFPIEYYGTSLIKIYDNNLQSSDFPLYPSYDINSFQYGLFLLNRNIGQIMHHCRVGGRHTDYRKTLENLKELMEQYFINSNNNPIQLYTLNQQSIETTTSNNNSNERISLSNRRTITVNSVTSSFTENNDLNSTEDDNHHNGLDLFPTSSTLSPRLTMQYSYQPQQQ